MTKIVHIETATSVCSVCLSEGTTVMGLRETHEPNSHSRLLTVFIQELLDEFNMEVSMLDAIALSLGPGSYTGLRIGASAVKGMAFASGLPVIGLDTLSILANRVLEENRYQPDKAKGHSFILRPMIDARRMEVYTAAYSSDLKVLDPVKARVITEESFSEELETSKVLFFGDGAIKSMDLIRHPNAILIDEINCSARFMPALALKKFEEKAFLNTAYFEPFYLKDFIATIPSKQLVPKPQQHGPSKH